MIKTQSSKQHFSCSSSDALSERFDIFFWLTHKRQIKTKYPLINLREEQFTRRIL